MLNISKLSSLSDYVTFLPPAITVSLPFTYTYTFENNIPNSLNINGLLNNINENINFNDKLITITADAEDINLEFNSILLTSEETTLENIINNYIPEEYIGNQIFITNINSIEINSTIYFNIDKINISNNIRSNLTHIKILSNINDNSYTYTIRLYDRTNNNEISRLDFNNTTEELVNITPLSNIPTSDFLMEIHVKVSNVLAKANIYSLYIYYDN